MGCIISQHLPTFSYPSTGPHVTKDGDPGDVEASGQQGPTGRQRSRCAVKATPASGPEHKHLYLGLKLVNALFEPVGNGSR